MFVLAPPPAPEWLTLVEPDGDSPAVRVLFAPVGPTARDAAAFAVAQVMAGVEPELKEEAQGAIGADGQVAGTMSPALATLLKQVGRASSAAMIREGVRDWSGLGDPKGKPLSVTPTTIEWFLGHELLFARADALYVLPVALRDAEKNGLAGSPDGTGAGATPAHDTASSPAAPIATADAATTIPASQRAPTSSRGRERKKVRASGR